MNINIEDIAQGVTSAYNRIKPHIHKTGLIPSHSLSSLVNAEVFLKCENEQYTGSFKARGSLNKVLSLSGDERQRPIITASTGNHALGFARALKIAGLTGTVYLPANASKAKIKALSYYPVEMVLWEGNSLSTEIQARKVAEESNATWVSPYNDIDVIHGQGTIGLEILEELPDVDFACVTVGGGGLISGIGGYIKNHSKSIGIIGCQPENSPEMTLSIEAGKIVELPEYIETLSDGSAGGIEPDAITFDICRRVIDQSILVNEEEIKNAIRLLAQNHKKIIEGSAGVAVASALKMQDQIKGKKVVIVLCGSNIDMNKFVEIMRQ